ncbi:MAG: hypothetical protein PHV37_06430 [Candidatus Gastranaerophilales bacterium]|nr:hypothetical protein [Candidatus Gastranaerophilales bacterium]
MDKLKIKRLFSGLCCSNCKSDFDEDSIKIMREEDNLYVVQIVCRHCKKAFGLAFLGLESIDLKPEKIKDSDLKLEILEGPAPISYDDVIDAHKFIKNMDTDWEKHIPSDFKG